MKRIYLFAALAFLSTACLAQGVRSVNLKKGQKFNVNTVSKTHIVVNGMGQDIETNTEGTSKAIFAVDDATPTGYTLSSTITAMKVNLSMMGQAMSYDTEHPDSTNPAAAEIDKMINKPTVYTIRRDGQVEKTTMPADMPDMANQLLGSGAGVKGLLLGVPKGLKVGDTFDVNDNDSVLGVKMALTYTVKSISGDNAAVTFNGTQKTDSKVQNQGMEVHTVSEGTLEGEATLDLRTGILRTSKSTAKMKGTASAMGMDMPLEGEVTTDITVSES